MPGPGLVRFRDLLDVDSNAEIKIVKKTGVQELLFLFSKTLSLMRGSHARKLCEVMSLGIIKERKNLK